METFNLKREGLFWLLLLLPFIYIAAIWGQLPAQIPTHFGIHGTPNGWGPKASVFIIPGINIFMYLLLYFLPKIDPKKMNYEFFRNSFFKIRLLLTAFFAAICVLFIHSAITGQLDMGGRWLSVVIFLMLALMGNFMINLKPNWFIGIRTPWTLSSDTVWKKTHLTGGRIWFFGGFAGCVLSMILKPEVSVILLIVFAVSSTLLAYAYSFILFKREQGNA